MTADAQPLPRRDALIYASGSFSGNLISRVVAAWLFFFYAASNGDEGDVTRRMPVLTVGALLTAANIIEAFDDPLIGYWTDRTRTRWGRRIPFIVLATPFWVLFFFLLWTPPHDYESVANAVYFFIVLELFHFFSTLSGTAFESLLPEIAPLNRDRVRIVIGQVLFGTIGAAVALIVTGPIIDVFGFQVMAAMVAVLAMLSRFIGLGGAWRHARRDVAPAELKLLEAFRSTLRNSQFLYFLPTFILFNMGVTLMTAALPFFAKEIILTDGSIEVNLLGQSLSLGEGSVTSLMAAVAIIVVLLSLPAVYALALKRGKAWVYSASMLFGAVYIPVLFFMGFVPGVPKLLQAVIFIAPLGIAMTGVFVFPNAIMADIIDYDALRTGMRREALYYSTQNLMEKTVVALHAAILAGLLILGGTSEDPLGIRLVGPVAGLSILVAYIVFRGYTLPDSVRPDTVKLD